MLVPHLRPLKDTVRSSETDTVLTQSKSGAVLDLTIIQKKKNTMKPRLAIVVTLGKEREPGVVKLGWDENFGRDLKGILFRSKFRARAY